MKWSIRKMQSHHSLQPTDEFAKVESGVGDNSNKQYRNRPNRQAVFSYSKSPQ